MRFYPKKFLKNSSIVLAMVVATIGLRIPIRPIPREQPEQVLDIRDSEGHRSRVEMPLSLDKVIMFTVGATLARNYHFLATPSLKVINFFKETVRTLLPRSTTATNLLDFTDHEPQDAERQNTEPGFIEVDSFEVNSTFADQVADSLALYGRSFPEDAQKIESAIRLDDPIFIASLDALLRGHMCNIRTEQVLEYISMALHPAPQSQGVTRQVKLSSDLKRDLSQFKVFHERHNLFAHIKTVAEGMGIRHRHSN